MTTRRDSACIGLGLIGTFGWFGQELEPLSWVFVILNLVLPYGATA